MPNNDDDKITLNTRCSEEEHNNSKTWKTLQNTGKINTPNSTIKT